MTIKVSDLIAKFLKEKKIEVIFGIIGGANSHIFDSINNLGYTKIVCVHHEQCAVMAAGAYYRTNGKLSAAIVTAGPGSVNAITGVLCNWADSIPCLIISGQEPTKYLNLHSNLRMYGTQGFNIVKFVENITKFAKTIKNKNEILSFFQEAYFKTLENRPGPVWLDVPMDIQSSILSIKDLKNFTEPLCEKNINYDINEIIGLINKSERPLVLGGHGIRLSNSQQQFKELIEKLKIPTLLSWSAIDILPFNNSYYFGISGVYGQRYANFILQNCDLLIVLGSRLALPQTGYDINNFAPLAKIIIVNNDNNELNKYSRYNIIINDDCKNFINRLLTKNINSYKKLWYNRCIKYKNDFPLIESCHKDTQEYKNSYKFVNNLSKKLRNNHIIAIGQGSPLPCCHQVLEVKEGQAIFASNGLGEMGNGLPSAIGAAFAGNGKEVILLDGDGSMMVNLQELQTIVGYNLPIKIIIFNNNGYLFIKHTQKLFFNGRYTAVSPETGVTFPDFKRIAYGFNIPYFNDKENIIEEFLNQKGYAIFEFYMNPEQDLVPKVKATVKDDVVISHPLEDMSPLLPIEIIEKNMLKINEISYKIRNLICK